MLKHIVNSKSIRTMTAVSMSVTGSRNITGITCRMIDKPCLQYFLLLQYPRLPTYCRVGLPFNVYKLNTNIF